jgi:hypothetical protein
MRDNAHTLSDFRVPTLSIECERGGDEVQKQSSWGRDLKGRQFRDVLYLRGAEDRRLSLAEDIYDSPSLGRLLHDVVYDAQKALRLAVKLHHFIRVKFTHWPPLPFRTRPRQPQYHVAVAPARTAWPPVIAAPACRLCSPAGPSGAGLGLRPVHLWTRSVHFGQAVIGDLRRLQPRQRRAQRVKARRVGISVAGDDATDCRCHRGQLVVGEVNCRHGLNGFSAKTFDPALHGELIAIRHIHHSDRY